MTGRVEQEYLRYIEEKKSGAPGNTVTLNIKDVAQHFYDFGLEDGKNMIKSQFEILLDK